MTIARRKFQAAMAAAGAAPLINTGEAAAQRGGRGAQPGDPLAPARPPKFTYTRPIIDAHFHWYPPEFVNLIEKEGAANGVTDIKRSANGELTCTVPGYHPYAPRATFRRDMNDVDGMLKSMDARNVSMSTLTQTNPHVLWAPPAFGLKLAQAVNDGSAALCAKYPKRFTAALTLPMQDVKASLYELDRARKLPGMKAVNITENILGRNLGS
jgi:aminocarboxymuconate-semialdehyde decarboxylase